MLLSSARRTSLQTIAKAENEFAINSRQNSDQNFHRERVPLWDFTTSGLKEVYSQVDSGGGGSAEVMVYSLGWGMGEPERRAVDRKRAQPPVAHTLSPDDGHEVDVLPLHNQFRILIEHDEFNFGWVRLMIGGGP
ncbi:jg2818 [Pararge aegeria aegeria]|uniref:Jg2818 protein n=1 Tax=Pararge aegeria aegeria TaxID=348720 RepID=A0A8S4RXI5_9NEOP|nr:jg2818 [Pararge aegeria aegeria]